ncbi:MAG: uridine kinase [Hyphomonadaceae bacterium]
MRPFLIAVAGGSGAGKTTFARALAAALLPARATIISEDDYYLCRSALPGFDARTHNFDTPAAKDHALLRAHLAAARRGEAFDKPLYDHAAHARRAESERIERTDALIVEGLHVLTDTAAAAAFDLKIYLEASEAVRLERRVRRDMAERARSRADILRQFDAAVRPMHTLHVAPQQACADLVLTAAEDMAALARQAEIIAQRFRESRAARPS